MRVLCVGKKKMVTILESRVCEQQYSSLAGATNDGFSHQSGIDMKAALEKMCSVVEKIRLLAASGASAGPTWGDMFHVTKKKQDKVR